MNAIRKSRECFLMVLMMTMILTGCNKILDVDPLSEWSKESFYANKKEADMALSGIYSQLANDNVYGYYFNVLLEAGTDETYVNAAPASRAPAKYLFTPSTDAIKNLWLRLYTCIQLVNQFENNLKADKFSIEEYNQLLAKARFMRGFCYFTLANWFGPVPLRLTPSTSQADNHLAPSPVKEVYEQAERDYLFAAEHLEHASSAKYVPGEPNKMAAHGLLARLYLKMGGYQPYLSENESECYLENPQQYFDKAKDQCEIIISDGWHGIVPYATDPDSYRNHFINYLQDRYDLRETLFEISFGNYIRMGVQVGGRMGNINGLNFQGATGIPRSFVYVNVGLPVYNIYSLEDSRRTWSIGGYYNAWSSASESFVMRYIFDSPLNQYYGIGKFRRWEPKDIEYLKANSPVTGAEYTILNNTPGSETDPNFTSTNFPILRYSDVLLMHAEAIIGSRNGTADATPEAVNSLNIVRERAGLDPYIGSIVHDDFFKELVDERLRELCFEGLRKQDLIRWNLLEEKLETTNKAIKEHPDFKPTDVIHRIYLETGENFDRKKHLLFPYPLQETQMNDFLDQRNVW